MQPRTKLVELLTIFSLVFSASAWGMQSIPGQGNKATANARLPHYILGPDDEIVILALDADEIANKPIRITTSGDINLPLVGRMHVAGMTLEDVETEMTERLR